MHRERRTWALDMLSVPKTRLIDTSAMPGYNSPLMVKRRYARRGLAIVLAALVSPVLLRPAYGYLDPGTGSYIIQLLVGGLLGGLFAIGLFWKRVIAYVKRIFRSRKDDAGHDC